MKKILAGFLAMTMALAAAGCGKVADNDSKEKDNNAAEISAEQSAPDDEEKQEESSSEEDSSAEESEAEPDTESKSEPVKTSSDRRIKVSNMIIDDTYMSEESTRPDDETLADIAELAVKQYEACRDQDKQGFLDTLSLSEMMNSPSAKMLMDYIDDQTDEPYLGDTEFNSFLYGFMLLYTAAGTDDIFSGGSENPDSYDHPIDYIKEFSASLTPENADELFEETLFYAITQPDWITFPENFYTDPSAFTIDDPIVYIELDECEVNERGTFVEFDMEIINGDYYYNFGEVFAWKTPEASGIYVSDMRCEPNEYGIYTIDDAKNMIEKGQLYETANTNAKNLYITTCEFMEDTVIDDNFFASDFDEFLNAGYFRMANSASGLDLSGARPESLGDRRLYDKAKEEGITSGYIYIGKIDSSYEYPGFFVQWRQDKNSKVIGQYPRYFDPYEADMIWGTYYENK